MKDQLYVYRINIDPNMPMNKALMYELIELFLYGVMTVSHHVTDTTYVTLYLKPNYEVLEKVIEEQQLDGLEIAEILQNHIDLFERIIQYHHVVPEEMMSTMQNAEVVLEIFAEYIANKLFEGLDSEISEADFVNFLHS